MRKFKGLSLVLVLSSMFFVYGCGLTEVAPANELLQESLLNSAKNMTSTAYELNLSGKVAIPDETIGTVDFDVNFTGDVDSSNLEKLLFALKADVKFSAKDYKNQFAKGEMRLSGNKMFFILEELSNFNGEVPAEMVSEFLGKWWMYEDLSGMMSAGIIDETAKQETIANLEKLNLFTDISYEGTETLMGEKTYKFTAKLDKDSYKTLMIDEITRLTGVEPIQSDLDMMDKMIESFDINGTYFVGVDDSMMHGFAGVLSVSVPDENLAFDINIDYKASNINKPVSIEEPADAQDLSAMFGGLFGAPAVDTTDYSILDESDYSTYDFSEFDSTEFDSFDDAQFDEYKNNFNELDPIDDSVVLE